MEPQLSDDGLGTRDTERQDCLEAEDGGVLTDSSTQHKYAHSAIARIPSKFGHNRLSNDLICRPLETFNALLTEYIIEARQKMLPLMNCQLLDLITFYNERKSESLKAIATLRTLLGSHDNESLSSQAELLGIHGLEARDVVRGTLAWIFSAAAFSHNSPFEDNVLWREIITYGFNEDVASMMIQEHRCRTMNTATHRLAEEVRAQKSNREFDAVMLPLVDRHPKFQRLHGMMAMAAEDIWAAEDICATVHAYNGEFDLIWPAAGTHFNPALHEVDDLPPDALDLSNSIIVWVIMPGARWKDPKKDWRICSRAIVKVRCNLIQDWEDTISIPSTPRSSESGSCPLDASSAASLAKQNFREKRARRKQDKRAQQQSVANMHKTNFQYKRQILLRIENE